MTRKKHSPTIITMADIAANLNVAALEWRAAMYEKAQIQKAVFEKETIRTGIAALQLQDQARRRMNRASVCLGAATALFAAVIGIVCYQVGL